jgi:pimeloyl-ACP methyl ester carboxylesterase
MRVPPTVIWHGSEDSLNPCSHGQWLASQVPEASSHLLEGDSHLSTWQAAPAMLDELLASFHDRTR